MVDVAVLCGGDVLLIRRGDGRGWALPGGRIEGDESEVEAMRRELFEETGVAAVAFELIGQRRVQDDPRNRDDRWASTRLGVVRFGVRPDVVAGDDAAAAGWFPLVPFAELERLTGGMFPPHEPLIGMLLAVVS